MKHTAALFALLSASLFCAHAERMRGMNTELVQMEEEEGPYDNFYSFCNYSNTEDRVTCLQSFCGDDANETESNVDLLCSSKTPSQTWSCKNQDLEPFCRDLNCQGIDATVFPYEKCTKYNNNIWGRARRTGSFCLDIQDLDDQTRTHCNAFVYLMGYQFHNWWDRAEGENENFIELIEHAITSPDTCAAPEPRTCPSDCNGCWNNERRPLKCNEAPEFSATQSLCESKRGTWCGSNPSPTAYLTSKIQSCRDLQEDDSDLQDDDSYADAGLKKQMECLQNTYKEHCAEERIRTLALEAIVYDDDDLE
jgi:hypothetical protein